VFRIIWMTSWTDSYSLLGGIPSIRPRAYRTPSQLVGVLNTTLPPHLHGGFGNTLVKAKGPSEDLVTGEFDGRRSSKRRAHEVVAIPSGEPVIDLRIPVGVGIEADSVRDQGFDQTR